jgi:hypothetical protein
MEKSKFIEQYATQRWGKVRNQILARRNFFAATGTVVADFHTRKSRRHGPYYRLAYYEQHRQKSIYLGASESLARQVALLLSQLQTPRRSRRPIQLLRTAVRASLRNHHARLRADLARHGLRVKGLSLLKMKR